MNLKDVKQVALILLGLLFVGGVGSWLFTVSAILGWSFFSLCALVAVDVTFIGYLPGKLRQWRKK